MKKIDFYKLVSNFFMISLILLFFVSIYLKSQAFSSYFLTNLKNWLIILTFIFSILFFYFSSFKIEKNDILRDNKSDIWVLKKDFFQKKYKILSKIPFCSFFYKNGIIYSLVFVFIIIIGFSNIFINMWKLPFHQDEVYHFSPAVTYGKTWEFAKWDFLYDQVWDNKWTDRNKTLTILTSYSQNIFWIDEFSSRLPVALAGFLWLFIIYFISLSITKNRIIALISMYIYSVNDVILYFSNFIRAYIFLIIFCLIIFYFSYRFLYEENFKKKILYSIIIIFSFLFSLIELHWSAIVLFPLICFVFLLWINQVFSIKKYPYIYWFLGVFIIIFLLNATGIIYIFKLPFGIQNMINLNIDFLNPQKIYLYHITNPYNLWLPLIFLIPSLFFINFKKNIYLYLFFIFWVIIPLVFSLYFFNRYEDFRYISLISGIFIIYVSIFIYYIWYLYFYNFKNKNYIFLILIIFIFTSFQFPWFKEIKPFTKISNANWQNIEWSRLHFRAAQPDNKKAFDYIFENYDNIPIVRLPDGWINWDDNYYLSKYLENYQDKKIIFYTNLEKSTILRENYNSYKNNRSILNQKEDFFKLTNRYKNIIVIWNTRDLVDKKIMNYLDTNCKNIAWEIWIVQYRIFEYAHPVDNYFPNVFVCEK